ncbi:hypothetical protein BU25DRAFT_396544 [Macroventuria anomochaeta]|uniref:Uncharacterized protein n=1 Tax=Macroventuria anomochaeta TaxID=301207 RepID=A0ACB6RX73_9PLEO|nr:uncharacterized protein BU25DRAFT_396544 [Macroventuria anomochaeta]KAF2625754.1 hypothetical protein BU25DRAFT_396544 [Macroventuria anomochaeta]
MASRPEMREDDESGFCKFFRNLPHKNEDTVRIFDRGDYYSAHGEDAKFIANSVYRTTAVLRKLGREPGLDSVTMTTMVFRNFLRDALFRLGKRIEIWQSTGKRMDWKVVKQASPGNLQDLEDELGGHMENSPIILAVKVSARASEARNIGVCFADASVRELGVTEFLDNDLYSNFESLLIQLGVKECLIQADGNKKDVELNKLRTIADNCGCAVAERGVADFGTKDIEQDLPRLLKDEGAAGTLPQTDLKLAMGAAACLIKYLGVMSDSSNFGQYQLYQHDLTQYMKLDAAALKALNLMPGPRDGAKNMSLYGLLNRCKTPTGSRLLSQWLKQPLMNLAEIERRQQLVEAFVNDTELRQTMQEEHLRSIPDLYRLAKKFQRKAANLEDVVRAYQVIIRLPGFLESFDAVMDEQYKDPLDAEYTSKLRQYSAAFVGLQDMVETTVDLDALDNHEFIIKPEFDEALRTIRKRLDRLKREMESEHMKAGDDLNQDTEKKLFLENHKVHGWCFRLTRNEAGCIRQKKQYQEISTQKNGVYFTTPSLLEKRRDFDQLSENYNRTQSGLVNEVVAVASSYVPVVEKLAAVLAHLDVIVAFAHVSVHAPTSYTRPTMHPRGTGNTILKEARHPCLEMQDDISFITNDVSLVRNKSEFLIITGPNMGGKSTYIRQIGVIALMAQIGCFVPASEAELTIFDCILARVGASDSQIKGVSTFMAEMLETANILKSATKESLIIIDELGRGTSTYDGFGLAWAISEYIVKEIGAFALFATHFHELTALADTYSQVENLHVVAHISEGATETESGVQKKREVTLLYKVEPGFSDQSFGIHVAELVRFPKKVINMAKRKADELEDFAGKHEEGFVQASREEVEEGSKMLKEMLAKWKEEVESQGLTKKQQIERMRELVKENQALQANGFFKGIQAIVFSMAFGVYGQRTQCAHLWGDARAIRNKLKVQLKLSISRLRMVQQKDTAKAKQQRREMAQLLEVTQIGKLQSARIRVENIIRSDITTELHEMLELYCELLLARSQLLDQPTPSHSSTPIPLDPALEEAVRSIIYAAPRTEIKELHQVRAYLVEKFGKEVAVAAMEGEGVAERVAKKLEAKTPSEELVDAYLGEIARFYGVPFGAPKTSSDDDDDEPSGGVAEEADTEVPLAADGKKDDEREALVKATPPRTVGPQSPLRVVPPSPSTDNVAPKLKLPGAAAAKVQKAAEKKTPVKKDNGPGGKIPDVDELSRRFAELKR